MRTMVLEYLPTFARTKSPSYVGLHIPAPWFAYGNDIHDIHAMICSNGENKPITSSPRLGPDPSETFQTYPTKINSAHEKPKALIIYIYDIHHIESYIYDVLYIYIDYP